MARSHASTERSLWGRLTQQLALLRVELGLRQDALLLELQKLGQLIGNRKGWCHGSGHRRGLLGDASGLRGRGSVFPVDGERHCSVVARDIELVGRCLGCLC
uniref:Uncharacterized protein n=1 Tax=Heterorhabditis bacteriophora TaxID=37862 RepID=A0A1I7WC03_HETBA